MLDLSVVSGLIVELLQSRSPEFVARLKQRLNQLLTSKGLPHFNEKLFGYRKFSEFLKETQSGELIFDRRDGAGAMLVSLKGISVAIAKDSSASMADENTTERNAIRNDVWQAFTNPDPQRKRFLHRHTHVIRHFADQDKNSVQKVEILGAPQDYAEILPIDGTKQTQWMADFLDTVPVQGKDRVPFDAMLKESYTSSINSVFSAALKEQGNAWKKYRKARINLAIDQWASDNGISSAILWRPADPASSIAPSALLGAPSLRLKVQKLLDLVCDDDIEKLILPTLLATIAIRARQ